MDIESLEQKAKTYVMNGQSREAVEYLESALQEKKEAYGSETESFKKAMVDLCDIYNDLASEMLERGELQTAITLLRKAEGIKVNKNCKVKTLNTLACYYRQIGKARIAESYLIKALEIQGDLSNTHLNLCAVLSELGKHEDAMLHAMQAIVLLQDDIISSKKDPNRKCDESIMAIAYLNLGVELEYLKRYDEAMGFYQRAQNFGKNKLPPDHPATINATNALHDLSKKQSREKAEFKTNSKRVRSLYS
jgi:tetratricopeptide (TPR) repeat protein